ncbi:hypothetical protein RRG08_048402 [Elysia crispata]|uniref:Uncharacterized protein n=1 Tax=Elysia crispata TaxID=231223 RepID=A0AAE1B933_9GAST|nr:hypothetical protein RRG08_048402 [Elysia crispata]
MIFYIFSLSRAQEPCPTQATRMQMSVKIFFNPLAVDMFNIIFSNLSTRNSGSPSIGWSVRIYFLRRTYACCARAY